MNAPTTTLDPRFSDPSGVATPWEATRKDLEAAELFWITTVRPGWSTQCQPPGRGLA